MSLRSEAREKLKSYIERIEHIGGERKELGDAQRALFAEAKAEGFDPKAMRRIIKRRDKDSTELAENEAIDDLYAHALGMAAESPLYTAVSRLSVDALARDEVIATLQLLIPANGEIIARVGGAPMRLWRDETGNAHAAEYIEPVATSSSSTARSAGKALKTPATVLTMVPKDHVTSAADRAEERARRKKPVDEPSEGEKEPAE